MSAHAVASADGAGQGGVVLHASAVAIAGRALLILGPSGSGKSALALRLMAFGAGLIADDRTGLRAPALAEAGAPLAFCPSDSIRGLIEARGIGILRVAPAQPAPVALVVDLGQAETERLPPQRVIQLLDCRLPLVLRPHNDHLAEALLAWMSGGRQE